MWSFYLFCAVCVWLLVNFIFWTSILDSLICAKGIKHSNSYLTAVLCGPAIALLYYGFLPNGHDFKQS